MQERFAISTGTVQAPILSDSRPCRTLMWLHSIWLDRFPKHAFLFDGNSCDTCTYPLLAIYSLLVVVQGYYQAWCDCHREYRRLQCIGSKQVKSSLLILLYVYVIRISWEPPHYRGRHMHRAYKNLSKNNPRTVVAYNDGCFSVIAEISIEQVFISTTFECSYASILCHIPRETQRSHI